MTQTQIDPSPGRKSARPANRYQHKSMRTEIFRRLALFTGSIVLAFYVLAPIAWLVSSSVQTESEITSRPPNWIPDNPTLDNFRAIFFGRDSALSGIDPAVAGYIPSSAAHLLPAMQNSMIVGLTVVILNLLVAIPAGYAIARIRFRGRSGTMYFILTTRVVPDISLVVPFFLIIRSLGLLDTHLALIISYLAITVPFTVFIMMSYFASLPEDLDKAARVDGCSRLQSLWHVYLPIATPAIICSILFGFLFSWNEFLFALMFTQTPGSQTLPIIIAAFASDFTISFAFINAAALLAVIPPVILAVLFQRYFVSGLAAGAVKG